MKGSNAIRLRVHLHFVFWRQIIVHFWLTLIEMLLIELNISLNFSSEMLLIAYELSRMEWFSIILQSLHFLWYVYAFVEEKRRNFNEIQPVNGYEIMLSIINSC